MRAELGAGWVSVAPGWTRGMQREDYRKAVKRSALVGAMKVCIEDAACVRNRQEREDLVRQLDKCVAALVAGIEPVAVPVKANAGPQRSADTTVRHKLVKYGARFRRATWRGFTIDGAQLIVYKSVDANAPQMRTYNVVGAEYTLEERTMAQQVPPFEQGFEVRVRLVCQERDSGPLFLYADDRSQTTAWIRALRMAKYFVSPDQKVALQTCLRYFSVGTRRKAWEALVRCMRRSVEVREMATRLSMMAKRSDLGRGWNKLRLAYFKQKADERDTTRLLDAQKSWAKQAGSDEDTKAVHEVASDKKMEENAGDLRSCMITRVQQRFRSIRQDRLGPHVRPESSLGKTRVQQARRGGFVFAAFDALPCNEVLRLVLRPPGRRLRRSPRASRLTKEGLGGL
eukprot:CAMPEP_0117587956 /NCGR_PEP_ID=MMETSP0784-20121206/69590_1 /TAXON_ID=39447 /ORGANISM="" /LENGTH=398 /DNA_ID=CAMNT_0005389275 /DNA_START=12 /DNA_END=1204 /DNA_ORIENTATION=-